MAKRPLTPDEALDPRNRPTIEQLLTAIHEVNPTNRQLTPAETSRRYALKSRLQSLLIRKFPHALAVEAEDDGVVLLRHVRGDRDFCHAVLAQLDDDARSWVRLQLDTPAEPARPAQAPVERTQGRADPLAEARAALEAWDYDLARALLDQARIAGVRAAIQLLVELLVDSLGDDAAALALDLHEPDAPVRARLAVAAARSGAPGRALRLLGGVTPPQAAEARLLLAGAALAAGNLEGAERFLALAREGDPQLPGLLAASERIESARRARIAPLEAELRASRSPDLARRILEIHPESPLARDVIKQDGDQRRRQHRDALLAEAKTAEHAGDLVVARERFQLAADAGADVRADLDRLTRIASERRVSDAVVQVRAAVTRDLRDGVSAWLGLEPTLRAQVRAEPTRWLAGVPRCAGSRANDLADAAIAASKAETLLASGDALDADSVLRPHLDRVVGFPGGKGLIQRLQSAVLAAHRRRADRALAAIEAEASPSARLAQVEALDLASLDPNQRALAAQIAAAARVAIGRQRLADTAASSEDLFRSRDAASTLASQEGGAWSERVAALQEEIQRQFRVTVWDRPDIDLRDYALEEVQRPGTWLTADGRLILVSIRVHQVLVRVVDPATGVILRAITCVVPAMIDRVDYVVDGESVWIWGLQPNLLHLDLRGAVLGWWSLAAFVPKDEHYCACRVAQGGRYLWLVTQRQDGGRARLQAYVIDLPRGAPGRHILDPFTPDPLRGRGDLMYAVRRGQGIALFHPDGSPVRRWDDRQIPQARSVAVHPSREGSLVVMLDPVLFDPRTHRKLSWIELHPETKPKPEAHEIELSSHQQGSDLVTALGERATFITVRQKRAQLLALVDGADGLEESWAIEAEHAIGLAKDERSERTMVVYPSRSGVSWRWLTRVAPNLDDGLPPRAGLVTSVRVSGCPGLPQILDLQKTVKEAAQRLMQTPNERREALLAATIRAATDVNEVKATVIAARLLRLAGYSPVVRDAASRFPRDGVLQILAAMDEAHADAWDLAAKRLKSVEASALSADQQEHLYHLQGCACWHLGDVAGARRHWLRGAAGHHCPNAELAEIAGAHLGQRTGNTRAGRLATAIATADERLAAGDPRGAIEATDPVELWLCRENQVAARRAEAWLQVEVEPGSRDDLRRRIALSTFREVVAREDYRAQRSLPIPGAYGEERLDEIDGAVGRLLHEPEHYMIVGTDDPKGDTFYHEGDGPTVAEGD